MMDNYQALAARLRRLRPVAMLGLALPALLLALGVVFALSSVKIDGDQIGIVEKKLGGGPLPQGSILAVNGENGIQAEVLTPGWHFFYWPWQYDVSKAPITEILDGNIGLLTTSDGRSLPPGSVYAAEWEAPDQMIDAKFFLGEGEGYKGPQLSVLKPGKYRLNPQLFTVTTVPVTNVQIGTVAVVKSNVGELVESDKRLVEKGQRGIWNTPLSEGKYYLNTNAYEMTMVDIRQVKVSYTRELEAGEAEAQERQPISVRSKDGFTFPVDVRVSYRISRDNAPLVVSTIGGDAFVLSKLVTPSVRAIFRNNAEKVKALDYVQNRSVQEQQSASMLEKELQEYGVTVLAVRIGDVGDKDTLGALLKTQTDREIALQEQATFEEQQRAAEKEKALESTRQEAVEEKRLATAAYGVKVAEQEKQKRIIDAQAEAEQVKLIAEAKAQAYKIVSEVIGADNAALLEIMKLVSAGRIQITPSVMVGGNGGGMTDALMGTMLKDMLNKQSTPQ